MPKGIGKNQRACYFFALHFIIIPISDSQQLVLQHKQVLGPNPNWSFNSLNTLLLKYRH